MATWVRSLYYIHCVNCILGRNPNFGSALFRMYFYQRLDYTWKSSMVSSLVFHVFIFTTFLIGGILADNLAGKIQDCIIPFFVVLDRICFNGFWHNSASAHRHWVSAHYYPQQQLSFWTLKVQNIKGYRLFSLFWWLQWALVVHGPACWHSLAIISSCPSRKSNWTYCGRCITFQWTSVWWFLKRWRRFCKTTCDASTGTIVTLGPLGYWQFYWALP